MSIRFAVETGLQLLVQDKPNSDKFMNHCRIVADHAAKALKYENLPPRKRLAVELAALLHDLDNVQYFPESVNNQNTRRLLEAIIVVDNRDEFIADVITIINLMYSGEEAPHKWMYIPRDCDCLEAISTELLKQHMTSAITSGRALHLATTPRAYSREAVLAMANIDRYLRYMITQHSASVIDYCYDKLSCSVHPIIFRSQNPFIMNEVTKRTEAIIQIIISYWLTDNSVSC